MLNTHEVNLFEHVLWHCQNVYKLNTPQEAVIVARRDGFLDWDNKLTPIGRHVAELMMQDFENYKDGFLDWDNKLTPIGRHVAELMMQDFENYKSLFEVDVKKPPGYIYQPAIHQLQ